ncbi:MAG: CsgG/HfaB family protein [Elusimicrobia bacterium]|nr:CsgG/HfaB family protein [Candidatus Liberimonas magnetica]
MNKAFLNILIFIVSAVSLNSCIVQSTVLKPDYDFNKIKRVAVIDFQNAPNDPVSGAMAQDLFIKYMLLAGYNVVERGELEQILKERHIALSGMVEPKEAKTLGRISGIDAIVTGSVQQFIPENYFYEGGNPRFIAAQVGVTARMIDVGTGEVLWSGSNSYDGMNTQIASEYLISSIVRQFKKDISIPN